MAQISCSLECCIVLFPGDAVGRMGLVSASGYSISVDKTTLWGAGLETRTQGQSKCLAKNTEPVLFLSGGTVYADGSQTLGISISQGGKNYHIKKKQKRMYTDFCYQQHLGRLEQMDPFFL